MSLHASWSLQWNAAADTGVLGENPMMLTMIHTNAKARALDMTHLPWALPTRTILEGTELLLETGVVRCSREPLRDVDDVSVFSRSEQECRRSLNLERLDQSQVRFNCPRRALGLLAAHETRGIPTDVTEGVVDISHGRRQRKERIVKNPESPLFLCTHSRLGSRSC